MQNMNQRILAGMTRGSLSDLLTRQIRVLGKIDLAERLGKLSPAKAKDLRRQIGMDYAAQ